MVDELTDETTRHAATILIHLNTSQSGASEADHSLLV